MSLSSFGVPDHRRYMPGTSQLETYRYAASERIMGGRKTNQTDVPPPEDPDRKRVLNVLAQRRYRQRQRQRLQELESKANQLSSLSQRSSPQSEGSSNVASNDEQLSEPDVPGKVSYSFNIDSNESFSSLLATAMQENGSQWPNPTDAEPWIDASNANDPSLERVDGEVTRSWATNESNDLQLFNDMSGELQDLETSQYQFPDDALLDVSELKVIRASFEIAILLKCQDTIWDVGALRTFNETTSPGGAPLPPSFLPTEEQREIPHHPALDILPWPAVRSKLIRVFNRAPHIRPPVARGPMAVVKLLQDMEAPAEGLRVNGPNGYDATNWEVGQQFFANWWWALECSVIERSSTLRVMRGAESLHVEY